MSDKERILILLLQRLAKPEFCAGPSYAERQGFAFVSHDNPKIGDLVIAQTSGTHPYSVGYAVSDYDPKEAAMTVREIGSERTCRISNDSFYVIRNIPSELLYEGHQQGFRQKVLKAFQRGGEYRYRYGGVEFDGDEARIGIREVFGGHHYGTGKESVPFYAVMKWDPRMSIKAILESMRGAGYGTREFDTRPTAQQATALPTEQKPAADAPGDTE